MRLELGKGELVHGAWCFGGLRACVRADGVVWGMGIVVGVVWVGFVLV